MARLKVEELTPLAPMILIRRLPAETEFGHLMIVLPTEQNFKNRRCIVERVHRGRKHKSGNITPPEVQVGDLVEVIVFDGEVLDKYEDTDLEWVNEDNILCTVVPV
jgi:co-chaperonin GroES (HSP10)